MNSVFALMLVTATGVVEAPNTFATMDACQQVVNRISFQSYCIEKKPVNVEAEMSKFIALFKNFQRQMENDFSKDTKQKAP